MTKTISTIRIPGFHNWPQAPNEVGYLGSKHRHLFTIRCEWPVHHDDRDVEFHLAQQAMRDVLEKWREGDVYEFEGMSCEMIARAVGARLEQSFREPSAVEVWEDDECGARVE